MPAQVRYFPSQEDLMIIKHSIRCFLKNQKGIYRDKMLFNIRRVLDKYGISKYNFAAFSVHRSVGPGLSFIQGRHEITDRFCPGCGSDLYMVDSPVRILSILEGIHDKVIYGCACGEIFFQFEEK
ncbi:hypothetical protein [Desulforamulus putei]|nr:hypothetical protein [Desulforamulus putei]